MKKVSAPIAASLIFTFMGFVLPKHKAFHGEIMDSQCGEMGMHGVIVNPLKTARQCTTDCVRIGGKYVLYDAAMLTAYSLDDQRKTEVFAGDKLEVTGTLDKSTHMIHVIDIRVAE